MKLIVWEIGKMLSGETKNSVNLVTDLNIKFSRHQGNPIADNWVFYDVLLPDNIFLPDYIEVKK